jgi:hypothetical protein
MKIIYENKYDISWDTYKLGKKLVGLKRNGRRPEVYLSVSEVKQILEDPEKLKYFNKTLCVASKEALFHTCGMADATTSERWLTTPVDQK